MKSVFCKMLLPLAFVICLLFLASAVSTFAQDLDDVTISGKIADQNGQAVVGATVTATRTETNVERTVTTDEDGRYRIVELQPGTYAVKSTSSGFGIQEKTDLVTIAGQNVQLNFTLVPAGISAEQTVTIEEDSSTVDTTRTIVGGTVTRRVRKATRGFTKIRTSSGSKLFYP